MTFETYAHRFADVILNSDFELWKEIEDVIHGLDYAVAVERFNARNMELKVEKKRPQMGRQRTINKMFQEAFEQRSWEREKNVFGDPTNDLRIDFWKRNVGIDVAFNHRSYTGGDLLRFQAAAEVKNVINVGVYVCPKKTFAVEVSPGDGPSMVNFERTQWYLENLYAVLTAPILVIGLTE